MFFENIFLEVSRTPQHSKSLHDIQEYPDGYGHKIPVDQYWKDNMNL